MYKILVSPVNGMVQIELTTADDETFISLVLSHEQADALRQQLHDSLKLGSTGDPKRVNVATTTSTGSVEISRDAYNDAVALIKRNEFINAIKSLRTAHMFGLKEAKDICDRLRAEIVAGVIE